MNGIIRCAASAIDPFTHSFAARTFPAALARPTLELVAGQRYTSRPFPALTTRSEEKEQKQA